MKYLLAAVAAIALYGVVPGGASAADGPNLVIGHHNTQHSLGPCGIHPCPKPTGGK